MLLERLLPLVEEWLSRTFSFQPLLPFYLDTDVTQPSCNSEEKSVTEERCWSLAITEPLRESHHQKHFQQMFRLYKVQPQGTPCRQLSGQLALHGVVICSVRSSEQDAWPSGTVLLCNMEDNKCSFCLKHS